MIRERVKKQFFGEISPKRGWVGWLIPKQGPNPSKPPPNCSENRFFRPKFHLSFSQISQKPWGGWVNRFGKGLPKKTFFWDIFPKSVYRPTHPRVL